MDQPYQRQQQSTLARINNNPDYCPTMPISNPPSSITPNIASVNLNLMDPSNKNTNLNPYLVVNHPVPFGGTKVPTVSKTLSLPRVLSNNFGGGGTKKRNSKSFVDADAQPVVNPAFTDGLVRPVAISDYDDPLRFIQLPPAPNFKPEVVNIKTNQQINPEQPQPSVGPVASSNTKSIPSFRLTRNVSSTLSKLTSSVEFHTLPRQFQTDQINIRNSSQMDIPLSSFHLRDKQNIDENGELAQQRLSTASTVSNQSSNASSGDPSTTSSLYYVDCRRQSQPEKEHQRSSDRSTSMSSASSTITGSSGATSSDGHPTTTTSGTINQNDDFGEEDLPPPPDTLLRSDDDDDEESGNSGQQTFGQQPNKSTSTINNSSNKLITQLLPPLPPSDYHSITTLQRRKQQQQQQQQQQFPNPNNSNYHQPQQLQKSNVSQVNGDVPAYSTTTLRSFQSASSGTLRKPPPPPPPPRPQASNLANSGFDGCSSNASTTYADPSSISIGSSSPVDNLTMSTQPTPSPTSDPLGQHPSADNNHSYGQQRTSMHQTKTLFNRNSSPTYGWVYHQPDTVIRYDSTSLADSGGSGGQPNSLESGDSRQPLSHSFDTNNNDNNNQRRNNNNGNNFHVYRNQVFTQDETIVRDEDDGHQTKARYVDGPYKMFYDSLDDHQSSLNGNNPINDHDPKNKKKQNEKSSEVGRGGHKEGCFRRCCRSLIIITTIALLIFMLMILGATLYYRFALNKPETGFSAIQQMQKYLFGEEKVLSGSNSTATTPTVFTSISAAVTLLSSTFTTPSITAKTTKPLIPTTPSSIESSTTESIILSLNHSTTISIVSVDKTSTTTTTDRPIISETTTNEETSISSDEDETTTSDDSEPDETTVQPLVKKSIPVETLPETISTVNNVLLTTEPPPATIKYEDETLEGFVVHRGSSSLVFSTEESSSITTDVSGGVTKKPGEISRSNLSQNDDN